MKQRLFLLLLSLSALTYPATDSHQQPKKSGSPIYQSELFLNLYYNKDTYPTSPFTPEGNSRISEEKLSCSLGIWDLNGVVFDNSQYTVAGKYAEVYSQHGLLSTIKATLLFAYIAAKKEYYKYMNYSEGYVWDAMFQTLSDKQTAQLLADLSRTANIPNADVVMLLEALETYGHENVILSNMGQNLADIQRDLLFKQQETVEAQIAESRDNQEQDKLLQEKKQLLFLLHFLKNPKNVIASEKNGWLHKPATESYQTCLDQTALPDHPDRFTFFIDDKQRNIDAALLNPNIDVAIKFTNAANLHAILTALGVLKDTKKQLQEESLDTLKNGS